MGRAGRYCLPSMLADDHLKASGLCGVGRYCLPSMLADDHLKEGLRTVWGGQILLAFNVGR